MIFPFFPFLLKIQFDFRNGSNALGEIQQMNEPSNADKSNLNLKLWFLSSYYVSFFNNHCFFLFFFFRAIRFSCLSLIFSSHSNGFNCFGLAPSPAWFALYSNYCRIQLKIDLWLENKKYPIYLFVVYYLFLSSHNLFPVHSFLFLCVHINLPSLHSDIASAKLKLICMQLLIEQKIAVYVNGNHF